MKNKTLALLFFLLQNISLEAQEDSINLSLIFDRDSWGLLDIVRFRFALKNMDTESISVTRIDKEKSISMRSDPVNLEYKRPDEKGWNLYSTMRSSYSPDTHNAQVVYLQNGQEIISGTLLLKPACSGNWDALSIRQPEKLLIKKSGRYEFRAHYVIRGPNGRISNLYSEKVSVYLHKYKKHDKKAYKYLLTTPKPYFLSINPGSIMEAFGPYIGDTILEKYAEHIIEKFPKSHFAPQACLFLAKVNHLKLYQSPPGEHFVSNNEFRLKQIKQYLEQSKAYKEPKLYDNLKEIQMIVTYIVLREGFNGNEKKMKAHPIHQYFPLDNE